MANGFVAKKTLFLLFISAFLLAVKTPVQSHDVLTNDVYNQNQTEQEALIYFWSPSGVESIDPITKEITVVYDYQPPVDNYLLDIDIDIDEQKIFVIEGLGSPVITEDEPNRSTQIVQINMATDERTILWEGLNASRINLSPMNNQLLVHYRKLLETVRDLNTDAYCVIDLQGEGTCDDKGTDFTILYVQWFDEQTILEIHLYSNLLVFVDVQTLDRRFELLEDWEFHAIDTIPHNNRLFSISLGIINDPNVSGGYFGLISLNDFSVEKMDHRAIYNPVLRAGISPTQQYFYYIHSDNFVLVNTETQTYHELSIPFTRGEKWFSTGQGLVTIATQSNQGVQQDVILYIEAETGATEILATYPSTAFTHLRLIK